MKCIQPLKPITVRFFILLLCIQCSVNLQAQEKFSGFSLGLNAGVYDRFSANTSGMTVGIDGTLLLDQNIFSAGYSLGAQMESNRAYLTYEVLYGRSFLWDEIRFYAKTGLSLLKYRYLIVFHNTVGIPIHAGFSVMTTRFTSIGLDLFIHANPKMPFAGGTITFQLGKLLPR